MNSNQNLSNDKIANQQNKEEVNMYSNKENIQNFPNNINNINIFEVNKEQNFPVENNMNKINNNSPPNYLLEQLNSKPINDHINSLLFEIKKLNIENEELKLNFVQVSELREKETQNYKYNLNVLKSNIEILEQDKQRHINQNIIEKENLENQVQILTKENNILNQRIREIIEQNEILNKQILEINMLYFGKNKKIKNTKELKNKAIKNTKISNTDLKNNNTNIKKDKNINISNSNLRSKTNFSINLKNQIQNQNNFPMKISQTSKLRESKKLTKFDQNYSIELNKLDKGMNPSKSNNNSNLISNDSTKFNIIENDYVEKSFDEKENKKYIPEKYNKYQINLNNEKNENNKNEVNKFDEEIFNFANKYLNNPNIKSDMLLKTDSIEMKDKDLEKINKIEIDNSKNIDET